MTVNPDEHAIHAMIQVAFRDLRGLVGANEAEKAQIDSARYSLSLVLERIKGGSVMTTEDRLAPKLPCPACGVPHPYGDACATASDQKTLEGNRDRGDRPFDAELDDFYCEQCKDTGFDRELECHHTMRCMSFRLEGKREDSLSWKS